MKISYNWLKEYIDLTGITLEQLIHDLTMAGLEVESSENKGEQLKGFIVGKVVTKEKHPNADKLSVCLVDTGSEVSQIVCGAPNVSAGQTVPVALPGAVVASSGMQIKKAKLRGVESNGMICSEVELGVGDDHSGIMVLPDDLKAGTPLAEALGLDDIILEIGITPNRPDALSHIGVARDISAIYNRPLLNPYTKLQPDATDNSDKFKIIIEDSELCPRYSAKIVQGGKVADSPEWLQKKIKAVGLRPINNIVDITNFILYESGQPIHAFDLDKLNKNTIIVKRAGAISTFTTLDSKKRELPPDALMICDGEKPVAIAGVMGGENSEVTSSTVNVLIESAFFNAGSIRKTAKSLGLSTDASYRFERGTDPQITALVAKRAAELIQQVAGGTIINTVIDIYPGEKPPLKVEFRYNRCKQILGYEIPHESIKSIIRNLGFVIVNEDDYRIEVVVPTFRPDIEREIDIIEEVARIFGYDKIPTVDSIAVPAIKIEDEQEFETAIRDFLIGYGLNEILNNSFMSKNLTGSPIQPISVLNPQNADMVLLRTSLVPGMLETIRNNIYVSEKSLAFFEIGKVFELKNPELKGFDDFQEKQSLVIALTGNAQEKEWYSNARQFDFFDAKGIVSVLLDKFFADESKGELPVNEGNYLYEYYLDYTLKGKGCARIGKVKKEILKENGIEQTVFLCEIDIEYLKKIIPSRKVYRELLRFPKVYRDMALITDREVSANSIKNFILDGRFTILKKVTIFDLFESESLGVGKKSLAFNLEFYDSNRTLSDEEVETVFKKIIKEVTEKFNAVLRG